MSRSVPGPASIEMLGSARVFSRGGGREARFDLPLRDVGVQSLVSESGMDGGGRGFKGALGPGEETGWTT